MDPWDILNDRIKNAKEKALQTDKVLSQSSFARCECGGHSVLTDLNVMKCTVCGKETLPVKEKIKKALEENKGVTARELAKIAGVSREEVSAFLDDGTLEIIGGSSQYIKCQICNTAILSGTVCPKCKNNYKEEFGSVNVREGRTYRPNTPEITIQEPKAKMHFLGKSKSGKFSK